MCVCTGVSLVSPLTQRSTRCHSGTPALAVPAPISSAASAANIRRLRHFRGSGRVDCQWVHVIGVSMLLLLCLSERDADIEFLLCVCRLVSCISGLTRRFRIANVFCYRFVVTL